MRAVTQRVRHTQVWVAGDVVGGVDEELCVLSSVTRGGGKPQIEKATRKIVQLRVLRGVDGDDDARRSAGEAGASILLVSQFTLYAGVCKGGNPGWPHAAPDDVTEPVMAAVAEELRKVYGLRVKTGRFGATMDMELVNDGPFTLLIEARLRWGRAGSYSRLWRAVVGKQENVDRVG